MLQLCGVSKRYGTSWAVESVSLAFPPGQTSVLIGPSGCGKSTLLRILVGLIQPDTGQVCIDGAEIQPRQWRLVRRQMGYVIQDGGLFPHLTLGGNITLMAQTLRRNGREIADRLSQLADLVHLPTAVLARYPHQVSGGQRQRAALMRALLLDPAFLLLDEPMGALDPLIRADLQAELREIFRALNKTVVLVTHDLAEACYVGDTIVLMDQGRIVQQGGFSELVHRPASPFVSRFLKAQRMGQPS